MEVTKEVEEEARVVRGRHMAEVDVGVVVHDKK